MSRYHLRYQSRSSMYICGQIPQNFAELAVAVLIVPNPKLAYENVTPQSQTSLMKMSLPNPKLAI